MERMPTILCIDDFKPGLATRKRFLETFGFSVLTAASGIQGLQILSSSNVDVVVLDYRMPVMDGKQVADRIRKIKPNVPIVLLSAVIKPFGPALMSKIDSLVVKGDDPRILISKLDLLTGTTASMRKQARLERFFIAEAQPLPKIA
jgi:CheY-like chemotaxis protein